MTKNNTFGRCFLWAFIFICEDKRPESDSGSGLAPHSLNSHIKLFKPHLEDLTLPLAYTRMSQLCPLPLLLLLELEHSWSVVRLQNWSFTLSVGPGRGLIPLLLLEQQVVTRWTVH